MYCFNSRRGEILGIPINNPFFFGLYIEYNKLTLANLKGREDRKKKSYEKQKVSKGKNPVALRLR